MPNRKRWASCLNSVALIATGLIVAGLLVGRVESIPPIATIIGLVAGIFLATLATSIIVIRLLFKIGGWLVRIALGLVIVPALVVTRGIALFVFPVVLGIVWLIERIRQPRSPDQLLLGREESDDKTPPTWIDRTAA